MMIPIQNKNIPAESFLDFKDEWKMKKLGKVIEKISDGFQGTHLYDTVVNIVLYGNNLVNDKIVSNEYSNKINNKRSSIAGYITYFRTILMMPTAGLKY